MMKSDVTVRCSIRVSKPCPCTHLLLTKEGVKRRSASSPAVSCRRSPQLLEAVLLLEERLLSSLLASSREIAWMVGALSSTKLPLLPLDLVPNDFWESRSA
jgi:hypothetical protein